MEMDIDVDLLLIYLINDVAFLNVLYNLCHVQNAYYILNMHTVVHQYVDVNVTEI